MLEKADYPPTHEDIIQHDAMLSHLYHAQWCGTDGCRLCMLQFDSAPMDANPHCSVCKGSGWLYSNKRGTILGTVIERCPFCKDLNKRVKDTKEPQYTFAKFFTTVKAIKQPQLENAKDKIISFSSLKGKPFTLIYGGCGCGKTHLCRAAENTLKESDYNVVYYKVSDLFDWLKKGFDDKQYSDIGRIEFLKESFVLILDDFKVEYTKEWGYERLESLLDFRYETFRPTLLTTNNNLDQLPYRIKSRFTDKERSEIIKIDLPDYRGLKK